MSAPVVLTHVYKTYEDPPVYVVRDFSVSIQAGEFFCLVGASGCGKSTVLKLIAGILTPSQGVLTKPPHVGMVFQSYALLPWLTVEDNVAFAARMQGFDAAKVQAVTERYVRMVHLDEFAAKFPRELSGGQRQRVGIARALAVESDVLLLDEPFSALDPVISDELRSELLAIWKATNKTIVMISHHFEEAVLLADRIGVMQNGTLKDIITVTLPRPRTEEQAQFVPEVKKLRACLA
ncbi:MAG: ABC transporter ATP-binding protein [Candidatus Eremiobacteraeota bacterium]|nr:ABC transporter ATP-binding protein [Candidatus Eremiobacteraeota bacterium]MBV8596883.1 ABC transporter ATP-binding protein [Candidatus Eremiobacteraeota bacterium]